MLGNTGEANFIRTEISDLIQSQVQPIIIPEPPEINPLESYVMTDKASYGLGETIQINGFLSQINSVSDSLVLLNGTKLNEINYADQIDMEIERESGRSIELLDYHCIRVSGFDIFYTNILEINKFFMRNDTSGIFDTPLSVKLIDGLSSETKNFVESEWTEGISSLWNSIDAKWVNHPTSILNAVNRLKQLKLGTKVGLKTPKTIVTNNPQTLKDFFLECNEEIIAKTLHSSEGLPNNKMIFTTKITKQDVDRSNELQYAPCMFQEYVPKKTEFRVTIIGDVVRAVEIHSQKSQKTMHDWRQYDDFEKTPYEVGILPSDIENSLIKLMKLMKLEFGAADLIRTPDDGYVFLEINPNGRWWWIQELTGINIARDIALYLNN